jgi:hypothetical protein
MVIDSRRAGYKDDVADVDCPTVTVLLFPDSA